MGSFTIQSTETGATKSFNTKAILGLLPAGDTVNDNIEIGQEVFKISSLVEDSFVEDATHRFATDAEKAHWNNAPVVAGELKGLDNLLSLNLNTGAMNGYQMDKSIDFKTRELIHANGTRACSWDETRNALYDALGLPGVIWALNSVAAGAFPESVAGYNRVLMDGNIAFMGHGAAALAWRERYLLDGAENLAMNWDTRKLYVAPPAGTQGTTSNDVAMDFSKGVGHRKCTQVQRLALVVIAADYGLQIYQTDGAEGLYLYKSTGWAFLG